MSTLSANRITDVSGKTILNNTGGILQQAGLTIDELKSLLGL